MLYGRSHALRELEHNARERAAAAEVRAFRCRACGLRALGTLHERSAQRQREVSAAAGQAAEAQDSSSARPVREFEVQPHRPAR